MHKCESPRPHERRCRNCSVNWSFQITLGWTNLYSSWPPVRKAFNAWTCRAGYDCAVAVKPESCVLRKSLSFTYICFLRWVIGYWGCCGGCCQLAKKCNRLSMLSFLWSWSDFPVEGHEQLCLGLKVMTQPFMLYSLVYVVWLVGIHLYSLGFFQGHIINVSLRVNGFYYLFMRLFFASVNLPPHETFVDKYHQSGLDSQACSGCLVWWFRFVGV